MEMKQTDEVLVNLLSSLGCLFENGNTYFVADPEEVILETLKYYWTDSDLFYMLFSLLKYKLSSLIHVERLYHKAKNKNLKDDELCLLIGLCRNFASQRDRRYYNIERKLIRPDLVMHNPPQAESNPELINIWGVEKSLESFGAVVRPFYLHPVEKFMHISLILKNNPWLRMRALIGVNYRADIIYLKSSGLCQTAYQASKLAGCTQRAAYNVWHSLYGIDELEQLIY